MNAACVTESWVYKVGFSGTTAKSQSGFDRHSLYFERSREYIKLYLVNIKAGRLTIGCIERSAFEESAHQTSCLSYSGFWVYALIGGISSLIKLLYRAGVIANIL
jgi:hypothetical protein